MSDYVSAIERAQRAYSAMAEIETKLERAPDDRGLRTILLSMQRVAAQAEERILALSAEKHVELCRYRLIPNHETANYSLLHVARSLGDYQNLYSQVYDYIRLGVKKARAVIGREIQAESALHFAYTFGGSLGVVLFAPSYRTFFEGKFDRSIEILLSAVEVESGEGVRSLAHEYGNAIVKRLYDWSDANLRGDFSIDLRWNRSDGRQLGEVVSIERMERMVHLIDQTSTSDLNVVIESGTLIGGDLQSGSFHFVVPNGPDFRGTLSKDFDKSTELTLGARYIARISEVITYYYATERETVVRELLSLAPDG